jgi:hypothetical protein
MSSSSDSDSDSDVPIDKTETLIPVVDILDGGEFIIFCGGSGDNAAIRKSLIMIVIEENGISQIILSNGVIYKMRLEAVVVRLNRILWTIKTETVV